MTDRELVGRQVVKLPSQKRNITLSEQHHIST